MILDTGTAALPAPVPARERHNRLPLVLGGIVAALVAAGLVAGVHLSNLHNGVIAATFTAVGVVVLRLRPGHREGWLLLATGLAHAEMFAGRQYGIAAAARDGGLPGAEWVLWAGVWPLPLVLVLIGVTMMCFPDGRLPSPRWRRVVAVMVPVGAALALASALWPVEYADDALRLPHPLSVPGAAVAQQVWDVAGRSAYLLFQLAWVACVVARLRTARGDEARQLRWFAYAVSLGGLAMVLSLALLHSPAAGLLAVPVVPVAAGVAIVRYRLYDLDLVITRSLVLGAMAALVTAGYVAVVVGAGSLAGVRAEPAPVLPLVATALVAVAFEPVRRRVSRAAERLVHGPRATPYEALARLPAHLRGEGPADAFAALAAAVAEGVGATAVTVWEGLPFALLPVASWPPVPPRDDPEPEPPVPLWDLAAGGRHVRPILHRGEVRGAITFTTRSGATPTKVEDLLLRDLTAQAGLVIENVDLDAELRFRLRQITAQTAQLRAGAKRLVAAQYEARRRIERDLHDGAQQQLVTLALSLGTVADRAAATGDAALVAAVTDARDQLSLALAELREMARGIHPAILSQEGLAAALGFLAERAPLPVTLQVALDERPPPDVEATAYFIASEALTNAAKHAKASAVTVTARDLGGLLVLEVADDGRGGVDRSRGTGLQGLVDRVAAVEGSLTVESPAGGGTVLRAELPCR